MIRVTELWRFCNQQVGKSKDMEEIKNIVAPLSGRIIEINVNVGDTVRKGQIIAILEAMKMDNELIAEYDGIVTAINVMEGDFVSYDTCIVTIE